MTYPREIIISTRLLREHQLSHILQDWVFMLSYSPSPAPFPQCVLSPDPNLARPKMLFVKINFQIRLESAFLARRKGMKTAREGAASGGGEGKPQPRVGIFGAGITAQQCCGRAQAAQPCSHPAVPRVLGPFSPACPWLLAVQGWAPFHPGGIPWRDWGTALRYSIPCNWHLL